MIKKILRYKSVIHREGEIDDLLIGNDEEKFPIIYHLLLFRLLCSIPLFLFMCIIVILLTPFLYLIHVGDKIRYAIWLPISTLYKHINKSKIERKKREQVIQIMKEYEESLILDSPLILSRDGRDKVDITIHGYDLKTFIKRFILCYNLDYLTVRVFDDQIVCGRRKRRSLGDIYLLCRSYYPSCTLEEVLIILITLCEKGTIFGSYCNQINKYVFHVSSNLYRRESDVEYSDKIIFRDLVDVYYKPEKKKNDN